MMAQYWSFTFKLGGIAELTPEVIDRLHEAGCDDATFALIGGERYCIFTREAEGFEAAVGSALMSLMGANVGAQIIDFIPRVL